MDLMDHKISYSGNIQARKSLIVLEPVHMKPDSFRSGYTLT